jgi:hypothetical protein
MVRRFWVPSFLSVAVWRLIEGPMPQVIPLDFAGDRKPV